MDHFLSTFGKTSDYTVISFTCRDSSNYLSGTRMAWSYSDWPMDWMVQGLNPTKDKSLFSSLKHLHQGWGPTTQHHTQWVPNKAPGAWLWLSPPSRAKGRNEWRYISAPSHAPIVWTGTNLLPVLFNYLWFSNNAVSCSDTTAPDNGMISEQCSGESLEVTMP
jgi:hypothetical protein